MALGAAFRAANLSTAFRVRKVGISDVSSFDITVRMTTLPSTPSSSGGGLGGFFGNLLGKKKQSEASTDESAGQTEWNKKTKLYPVKSSLNSKLKTVAFQYDKDILCQVEYEDANLPAGTDKLIAVYNVTGIADFSSEAAAKGIATLPKVHLSFSLDSSGLVHLAKAEVTVELPSTEPAATNTTAAVDGENATASTSEASATPTEADAAAATESATNGTVPDAAVNSTATEANTTSTATVH
eukprot:gene30583-40644_t